MVRVFSRSSNLLFFYSALFVLFFSSCVAFESSEFHVSSNEDAESRLPLYVQIILTVVLVGFSAVFSGLTLGIMGLDTLSLEIIAEGGPEPDAQYARNILPIRRLGHQVLVTLILGNMLANVLIAQACGDIEGGSSSSSINKIFAFLLSTFVILIFGEVLPMSICKSSHALEIAARSVPLVWLFILILYPIAKPLGMLLDCIIHHDVGQVYDRRELKDLMLRHCQNFSEVSGMEEGETTRIIGAMEFSEKVVRDIAIPLKDVFCIYDDCIIDSELIHHLWLHGRSRVPVIRGCDTPMTLSEITASRGKEPPLADKQHIVGIMYIKDLLMYQISPELEKKAQTVGQFLRTDMVREVQCISATTKLTAVMKRVQTGIAHLLIVTEPVSSFASSPGVVSERFGEAVDQKDALLPYGESTLQNISELEHHDDRVVGIVTVENVLEILLRSDICDEYDVENEETELDESVSGLLTSIKSNAHEGGKKGLEKRVNFYGFVIKRGTPRDQIKPLTSAEKWAITHYLGNSLSAVVSLSLHFIRRLIERAEDVVVLPSTERGVNLQEVAASANGSDDVFDVPEENMLYKRGVRSYDFILILTGCVRVQLGSEGFLAEYRTMQWLGEAALSEQAGWFVPNFKAFIDPAIPARYLRIKRKVFNDILAQQESERKSYTSLNTSFKERTFSGTTSIHVGEGNTTRKKKTVTF